MKEFLKNNKTALILFFLFLSIALISGIYLKQNTKENINLEQGRGSEQQSSATEQTRPPIATSSEQIAVKQEIKQNNSVQTTEPVQSAESEKSNQPLTAKENSTSTRLTAPAAPALPVGEKHFLYVGDKKYEIALKENSSVYDLMLALKQSGQLDFKGRNSAGLGFFVEEINGVENNSRDSIYWIYYINGKAAEVGISSYHLKANDIITWQYEKKSF